MHNPLQIVEGHLNLARKEFGIANAEGEQLAAMRENICAACTIKGDPGVNEEGRCRICNCKIKAAVRSIGKHCPIRKW